MKKIMKKALSLILVLALAIVPMTAMAAPGDNEMEAIYIQQTPTDVTVGAGATVYYSMWMPDAWTPYKFVVQGNTGFEVGEISDVNGTVETMLQGSMMNMGRAVFTIKNNTDSEQTYNLELVLPKGTEANPDTPVIGLNTADCTNTHYHYEWTATDDGVFTISMTEATLDTDVVDWEWQIKTVVPVSGEYSDYYYGDIHYSSVLWEDGDDVTTESIPVNKGDVVQFYVADYNYGDAITFNVDFVNYTISDQILTLDEENTVTISKDYGWTLFEFTPEESGVYKFQVDDGGVGYWGAGTFFVQEPTGDVTTVLEYPLYEAGPSIVVGIPQIADDTCNITITRIGDAIRPVEVEWTIYDNTTKTPASLKYDGDASKLTSVNVADEVVDTAVLGDDGYYHLNSKDGEILYVNLNDSRMSLVNVLSYGKLTAVYYDGDDVTEKIDFTSAIYEYLGVDGVQEGQYGSTPVIYPLTEDLMTIFQQVGEANGWYGANGYVQNATRADAWMYACSYVKGQTSLSTNTVVPTAPTTSPNTGDNANVALWALVMMVGVVAAATSVVLKKRER